MSFLKDGNTLACHIDVARGDLPWMWQISPQLFDRVVVSRALEYFLCFQTSCRMVWAARVNLQAMPSMADDTTDRGDSFVQ